MKTSDWPYPIIAIKYIFENAKGKEGNIYFIYMSFIRSPNQDKRTKREKNLLKKAKIKKEMSRKWIDK